MEEVLELVGRAGVLRARDLEAHGLARAYLTRLVQKGLLEQPGRGLYSLPGAEVTEHHSLAEVAKRVPSGVVCLLSALSFHGLTTQSPFEVWLAIGAKARRPGAPYPPVRAVRMSGPALTTGVEEHVIEAVPVRIFSAAKTVADCFKFRNKIGLDVAIEALRDYVQRHGSMDDLWRAAETCRVARIVRPYAEAIA